MGSAVENALLSLFPFLLLGIELSFYFRVRNSYKLPHKISELAEIASFILGGVIWLLRQS